MRVRGIDFTMYKVSNLKKSIEFYKTKLGLKLFGKPGDSWAEFEAGKDQTGLFWEDQVVIPW